MVVALAFTTVFLLSATALGFVLWKLERVTTRNEAAVAVLRERGWDSRSVFQLRGALRWIERQVLQDDFVRDLSPEDREEAERILRGGRPRELG